MRHLALALGLCSAACRHEDAPPPKLEPGETLPLPPASGTPIGFLLDDASELSLRDDQIVQLQAIDHSLQARLDVIDTQLRGYDAPPARAPNQPRQAGGRGGRRSGAGGPQTGGPRVNHAPGASPGAGALAHADDIKRLDEQRKSEVKDALGKAFAIFDVPQRILARKALAKHDIDLDAPNRPKPTTPPAPNGDGDGDGGDERGEP